MAGIKSVSGSAAYYGALQSIFHLQSKILTGVLPHAGERGSNDEERCRAFLNSVLPRRYSIGSGFVVSSTPGSEASLQQDVVIYDDFLNSPLHREISAAAFPIEMVYATVEVKGMLGSGDLGKIATSIASVRRLSMQSRYEMPDPDNVPGRPNLYSLVVKRPPRAFAFAFNTRYKNPEKFKAALERALNEQRGAHLHGIVVLSANWFAYQQPNRPRAEVRLFTDNALLRYVNSMLKVLKSTVVREADMSRYLVNIETAPPEEEGKT